MKANHILIPNPIFRKRRRKSGVTPNYRVISEAGPDHDKKFVVGVYLGDEKVAEGEGCSKQEAQRNAAKAGSKRKDGNLKLKQKVYLKRIEITGFKSFATKTVLDFLPSCNIAENGKNCGITAIVGPNGSGKSNVADAIKWAMGEQSLKNLRGKKSEDVIFAGSGKKAQLGSAKVSLYFDNSDKKIPIEFEEVVITRKIYRSGEGEYLINGSKVRLIDIHDLLAKAGVGQRSYCIINQGMADAVLNATPVERRIILEEAAGVKPYQLKKERSLRKLDTTRANMLRAADLVREIEPHLRVLKRQADKARKGEEVVQELKEKQKILFGSLWQDIAAKKENVSA